MTSCNQRQWCWWLESRRDLRWNSVGVAWGMEDAMQQVECVLAGLRRALGREPSDLECGSFRAVDD